MNSLKVFVILKIKQQSTTYACFALEVREVSTKSMVWVLPCRFLYHFFCSRKNIIGYSCKCFEKNKKLDFSKFSLSFAFNLISPLMVVHSICTWYLLNCLNAG